MSSDPDLTSVLRTLSAFAKPASSTPQQHQQHQPPHPHHERHTHTPSTQTSPPNPPPKRTSLPNAANITAYPTALKHIMHLTTQNQDFLGRIQHLIKSQRDHERTWWKARQALIEKQSAREEKRRRIEEVLKSVGASSANAGASATSPEDTTDKISQENATELKAYDSKVYQASLDMARAMETELRRLGVPFFCIDRNLVSTDEDEKGGGSTFTLTEESKAKTTKISKEELEVLKRRVLDLLVDLCS